MKLGLLFGIPQFAEGSILAFTVISHKKNGEERLEEGKPGMRNLAKLDSDLVGRETVSMVMRGIQKIMKSQGSAARPVEIREEKWIHRTLSFRYPSRMAG